MLISLLFITTLSYSQEYPFQNPYLPLEERIDDLISRLSLEEKASLMLYNSPSIDRLNIPAYNWWNECLHGVARAGRATVFPQAIGLAAAFDDLLMKDIGTAVSDEARAKFNIAMKKGNRAQYVGLTFWTPNINIYRDPRWGRGQETYGEDPYLTGKLGSAYVKGLQGDHPKYLKVTACAKHYSVHSGPEKLRHEFNAEPSIEDFRETYMPAFKTLVDAGVEAVMCAYNRTYDFPCCGSKYLLKDILRDEWGFNGHIVSDCWALSDFWQYHKVVPDEVSSAGMAANAGVNLECGTMYKFLPAAVDKGLVTEAAVDTLLRPMLSTRFRLGLFDPEYENPYAQIPPEVVNCEWHQFLAYEAAVKSMVLLKNENNVLPLSKNVIKNIFIAGPTAADVMALFGNYNGVSGNFTTFLEGITNEVDVGTIVDYSPGCFLNTPGTYYGFWEAQMADAIIVCLGNTRLLEGEEGEAMLNPEGGDRMDIRLPQSQREYIMKMREKVPDKPIIAVITGGGAIALQEVLEAADAVIFAWYPGEMGGLALADIVFGERSPSGKLPVTFYKSIDDIPPFEDYSMKGRTYKFLEKEPLFPFGFGLSYTSFAIESISTEKGKIKSGEPYELMIDIKNTGELPGEEVIMIFASKAAENEGDSRTVFPEKSKTLIGFQRVYLDKGQTAEVKFTVNLLDMYQWDQENNRYFVEPGTYVLQISRGSESPDFILNIEVMK